MKNVHQTTPKTGNGLVYFIKKEKSTRQIWVNVCLFGHTWRFDILARVRKGFAGRLLMCYVLCVSFRLSALLSVLDRLRSVNLAQCEARWTSEPRHDKTNKMSVRPAKTQISMGIRVQRRL